MTKWYDSDGDSYGSLCPKDKKYLCKRPPTIRLEEKFILWFQNVSKHLPYWALIKICIELQHEFNILNQARRTANLRRKAKGGQYCFIKPDPCCIKLLEWILCHWHTPVSAELDKRLVLLRVKDLSNEQQENYHEQNNHHQKVADK